HRIVRADQRRIRRDPVLSGRPEHDEPCNYGRGRAGIHLLPGRCGPAARDRRRGLPRASAGRAGCRRGRLVLRSLPGRDSRRRIPAAKETQMKTLTIFALVAAAFAADMKVDLKTEQVGKPPVTFEPMVGTWVVAQ